MLVNILGNPVDLFLDGFGEPLQGGSIYIGNPNTDPTNPANQITVYQDQGLSIPLAQPIKTTNGQPSLNGSQIPVYLGLGVTTYALAVLNSAGVVVMSLPSVSPFSLGGTASGNMFTKEFVAGVDYIGGTSTSLSLPSNFGSATNLWVDFDGTPQHYPDDFTLNGTTLQFTNPIPVGPAKVFVKAGTTLPFGTPSAASVTDAAIATGTSLYNRINQIVFVTDPQYGAKGDGTTDDTTAIQGALNSGKFVVFPAGKTFYSATGITVPVGCPGIMGEGATLKGPGSAGTIDGFTFSNWYGGGGNVGQTVAGARFYLPNINNFRYGINNSNSSFVNINCDLIKNCSVGIATIVTTGNYSVENDYQIGMILQCNYGLYESIPANVGGATEGVQGCRFNVFYLAGCNYGIYRNVAAGSVSVFNEYYIVELDANGCSGGIANAYALYNSAQSTALNANKYRIPVGPINCNASPSAFHFGEPNSVYEMLYFQGLDPTPYAFQNFLPIGPVTTVQAGNGTLYVNVSTSGSDTAGDGSAGNPFATIAKAIAMIQNMDHRGFNAVINLAAGTYSIGANYALDQGPNPNVRLYIRGQSNASLVTITGGINASGAAARLTLEFVTLTTAGINANNNAYVDFDNCIFGAMASSQHLFAQNGARIVAAGPYTINGNAIYHAAAQYDGKVFLDGNTVTLNGTPAFSTAFAYAAQGTISAQSVTFSGSATGVRYNAILNGVINTAGGGASYLPGSSAGTTSTGGQYA